MIDMRRTFCIAMTALATILASEPTGGASGQQPVPRFDADYPQLDDVAFVRSDMLAAFLVAYAAQEQRWRSDGVALTPHEFVRRHWAVHVSRVNSNEVAVLFAPRSPYISDGSLTYFVDRHSLKVVKTEREP